MTESFTTEIQGSSQRVQTGVKSSKPYGIIPASTTYSNVVHVWDTQTSRELCKVETELGLRSQIAQPFFDSLAEFFYIRVHLHLKFLAYVRSVPGLDAITYPRPLLRWHLGESQIRSRSTKYNSLSYLQSYWPIGANRQASTKQANRPPSDCQTEPPTQSRSTQKHACLGCPGFWGPSIAIPIVIGKGG
ncbi:hypothetical protein BDP55DRAFT_625101 [Colletotrichum godetiae]|uniref:Uncharacterized protein n=1 Tax=Colletotrichum godetiae TaxID=1209918 RepID=A0AAJ0AZS7_9PEZI|nr:uncharacterized protein BDP55DRAFT_625101 [Colletotrichum godetiae]KAK1700828.1 hypothetical protein BDP55DRAFT_625101 [Colletotrichum godetiae]